MTVDAYAAAPLYTVAGTGPYAIPFDYGGAAEIDVVATLSGVATTLGRGSNYTVDPAGKSSSGAVTLTSAIAGQFAGASLQITRTTPVEQGWEGQTGTREQGLEAQLDQNVRALQDLGQRTTLLDAVLGRSLRGPLAEGAVNEVPGSAARAGRLLAFDGAGSPIAYASAGLQTAALTDAISDWVAIGLTNVPVGVDVIFVLGHAAPHDGGHAALELMPGDQSAITAAPGRVQTANGRWFEISTKQRIYVEQFGARGDDATDNLTPLTNALRWTLGREVPCHAAKGVYRFSDTIDIVETDLNKFRSGWGLRGAGKFATTFRLTAAPTTRRAAIRVEGGDDDEIHDLGFARFADFTLDQSTRRAFDADGIFFKNTSRTDLERIHVDGFKGNGIAFAGTWDAYIVDVDVWWCGLNALHPLSAPVGGTSYASVALFGTTGGETTNSIRIVRLHVENGYFRDLQLSAAVEHSVVTQCKLHVRHANAGDLTDYPANVASLRIGGAGTTGLMVFGNQLIPGQANCMEITDGAENAAIFGNEIGGSNGTQVTFTATAGPGHSFSGNVHGPRASGVAYHVTNFSAHTVAINGNQAPGDIFDYAFPLDGIAFRGEHQGRALIVGDEGSDLLRITVADAAATTQHVGATADISIRGKLSDGVTFGDWFRLRTEVVAPGETRVVFQLLTNNTPTDIFSINEALNLTIFDQALRVDGGVFPRTDDTDDMGGVDRKWNGIYQRIYDATPGLPSTFPGRRVIASGVNWDPGGVGAVHEVISDGTNWVRIQ
ncbi:MAG: hypothetical protein AAF192_03915 [Pseudomonadota bacterium]